MVYFADHHDGDHVFPTATQPTADRPHAGQNDENHATHLWGIYAVFPCRFGAVLDGQ